jgi:hypothetical protein
MIKKFIDIIKSNQQICLISIIAIAFLVRVYTAKTAWVDGDEGNFLYDAQMLLQGYVPFRDYDTRSPLYITQLAVFLKLFGNDWLIARYLSVVSATISTYVLYKIGKSLYNSSVGLVASLIYAISPFAIFLPTILKTEPNQELFILLAMFFLIKGIKEGSFKYYTLNVTFLILAVFIRKSSLIFFPLELFLLMYLRYTSDKMFFNIDNPKLKKSALLIIAVCSIFIGILYTFHSLSYVFLSHVTSILHTISSPHSSFPITQYILTLDFISVLSFILSRFLLCSRLVWHVLSKEALYLIIPLVLFLYILVNDYITKRFYKRLFKILMYFSGLIFLIQFIRHAFVFDFLPLSLFHVLLLLSLSLVCILILETKDIHLKEGTKFSNIFLVFWFLGPFTFYLFYYKLHVMYLYELIAVSCLMSSVLICSLYDRLRLNKLFSVFIILLFCSIFMAQMTFITNPEDIVSKFHFREHESVESIYDVSEYLAQHTNENEEIFTGNNIFVANANRRLVMDISHPLSYHDLPDKEREKELIDYIDIKQIRYAVIDQRTNYTYFVNNPALKKYMYANYKLEKQINDIGIYKRI